MKDRAKIRLRGIVRMGLGLLLTIPVAGVASEATDQAEAAVSKALLQDFEWTFRSTGGKGFPREVVSLDGPSVSAYVDRETNILTLFFQTPGKKDTSAEPALTVDKAQTLATALLERVGISIKSPWLLVDVTYNIHGTNDRRYYFYWMKYLYGVELPAYLDVSIDADSGEVRSYSLCDDPVTIPIEAKLTAEEAIQIVAQKREVARPVVESARLRIWYEPSWPGPQVLFWQVLLLDPNAPQDRDKSILAEVNANTGKIVLLGLSSPPAPKKDEKPGLGKKPLPPLDLEAAKKAAIPPTVFELAKQKQAEQPAP